MRFSHTRCLIKGPTKVGPRGKCLILGFSDGQKIQSWECLLELEYRKNTQTSSLKRANLAPLAPVGGGQGVTAPAAPASVLARYSRLISLQATGIHFCEERRYNERTHRRPNNSRTGTSIFGKEENRSPYFTC